MSEVHYSAQGRIGTKNRNLMHRFIEFFDTVLRRCVSNSNKGLPLLGSLPVSYKMTLVSTIMTERSFTCLCTHNETFHCDEVVGAAMLQYLYNVPVIRTRNMDLIMTHQQSPNSIVLAVGQIYDHAQQCYDHHSLDEPSSSGLIYRHYGRLLIDKYIDELFEDLEPMDAIDLEAIYELFHDRFIHAIDDGHHVSVTLPAIIANMNYRDPQNDTLQGLAFNRAVKLCQDIMLTYMHRCIHDIRSYAIDLSIFEAGLADTPEHLRAVGVLELSRAINVEQFLKKHDPSEHYKYVIVPRGKNYTIWTVKGSNYGHLAPLMSENDARALYNDKVIFIHKSLSIGVATDKETATDIAILSAHDFSRKELESLGTIGFQARARARTIELQNIHL